MTNYDGRCRGGWAFGQGFDSPQVHTFMSFKKERKCRIYAGFRSFCFLVKRSLGSIFDRECEKKWGTEWGTEMSTDERSEE